LPPLCCPCQWPSSYRLHPRAIEQLFATYLPQQAPEHIASFHAFTHIFKVVNCLLGRVTFDGSLSRRLTSAADPTAAPTASQGAGTPLPGDGGTMQAQAPPGGSADAPHSAPEDFMVMQHPLVGLEALWAVALSRCVPVVAAAAAELLVSCHLHVAVSLRAQEAVIRERYLNHCMAETAPATAWLASVAGGADDGGSSTSSSTSDAVAASSASAATGSVNANDRVIPPLIAFRVERSLELVALFLSRCEQVDPEPSQTPFSNTASRLGRILPSRSPVRSPSGSATRATAPRGHHSASPHRTALPAPLVFPAEPATSDEADDGDVQLRAPPRLSGGLAGGGTPDSTADGALHITCINMLQFPQSGAEFVVALPKLASLGDLRQVRLCCVSIG
jgi:hypothetical protein